MTSNRIMPLKLCTITSRMLGPDCVLPRRQIIVEFLRLVVDDTIVPATLPLFVCTALLCAPKVL